MSRIDALQLCRKEAGVSFDPQCVDALIRYLESEEDTKLLRSAQKLVIRSADA